MTARCICPVCWHDETLRARLGGYEPCHADAAMMSWHRPQGGPRGQTVTKWDGGSWHCDRCQLRDTDWAIGTLLDAVLMCSHPDCDSIRDGLHEDTRIALKGGKV